MVRSSIAGLALAFALLSRGSVAVPIVADQNGFVRREERVEVSLSPEGEMIEEADYETPQDTLKMQTQDKTNSAQEELAKSGLQICRFDFVLGQPDTDGCSATSHEKITEDTANSTGHIIGLSLCRAAADQTGADFSHFDVAIGDEPNHPKGCFKAKCDLFDTSATIHSACFFYNGMGGDTNPNVIGTPVCSRPKLVYGSEDVQGCKAADTDYQVIDAEETCSTAANCLGTHPAAAEFRIGIHNASKHLDYLTGCVVAQRDKAKQVTRVYYNDKTEASLLGDGVPGHVNGTNICNVSSPLHF